MSNYEKKFKNEQREFLATIPELLKNFDFDSRILQAAENACGRQPGYSFILFPKGLREIVDKFIISCDEIMIDELSKSHYPNKIREKIKLSLGLRIKSFEPHVHSKIASYFLMNPLQSKGGLQYAWRTANAMWVFWGDKSIDFNYYSKRSLLAGVLLSSVLFYISDKSENFTATDDFIARSVENVVKVGTLKQKIISRFKDFYPF